MKLSHIFMLTTIITATSAYSSTKDDTNDGVTISAAPERTFTISAWTDEDQKRSDDRERQEVYDRELSYAMQTGSEMPFVDAEIAATRHDASKK